MLDIDLENIGEKLPLLLLLSGLFLLLYFTAYRKRIFSIFDPLSIMAVTQAASSVMAIALISQASMLWQFMLSQAAFTLGVVLAPVQSLPKGPTSSWSKGDIYFAEWVVMVLFSILVAANVWLGLSAGFPLFSDDPSLTKFSTFTGGLGLLCLRVSENPRALPGVRDPARNPAVQPPAAIFAGVGQGFHLCRGGNIASP